MEFLFLLVLVFLFVDFFRIDQCSVTVDWLMGNFHNYLLYFCILHFCYLYVRVSLSLISFISLTFDFVFDFHFSVSDYRFTYMTFVFCISNFRFCVWLTLNFFFIIHKNPETESKLQNHIIQNSGLHIINIKEKFGRFNIKMMFLF